MSGRAQRLILVAATLCLATAVAAATAPAADVRARPPQDEVVYFLLPDRFENGDQANDRGGLSGDRLKTGFDPTDKAFYHGGDLKGVLRRLDYIQGLGATAIWITPVFKNKPVQGPPGHESASYHGYWITDFTDVDPHLGTKADFAALVAAAHARGMKVYLDIVINHTADVIKYRECSDTRCPYRSRADYPYTRRGGVSGATINDGFLGDDPAHRTARNFARLTSPDWAYSPYVPAAEAHEKVPDWLNDPIYYHNRGDSTFRGESSEFGDFGGLDDLFTENPRVVSGFIDIYGRWIDEFGIDGFRIDTARHVDPEFWQAFAPAMKARAAARGIPHFYIFGEVATDLFDPAQIARHTRVDKLPQVLDFGFQTAVRDTVAGSAGTDELARLFFDDALYEGGEATATRHPTFVSNHDAGRFAWFARRANPKAPDAEILKRVLLAYGMLFTLRGVPIIYYGDEQGFAGVGGDQDARQDMFASKTAVYNAESLVGTTRTTAESNFNPDHPIYRAIAELAHLRAATRALREGRQVTRASGEKPGLFAVSRFDPTTGAEVVIAFNTSDEPLTAQVLVGSTDRRFASLHGACAPTPAAPGSYTVHLAPLDFVVCGEIR
ncbi:MAG TPA: alpha-amylase family glycosyl hydrolase [Caulobacteraceae bacterium]|jgi:glycosidase